ncbi:FG-GAP-like repeat-containing protein [Streptomyces sp. NPDC057623]|uniref:FG-GAP-like repeat-containing protein n=1 Tax=Streptomyces sp. NPDC057623 TaxID=3346187 RepID=UPI0036BA46B5
MPDRPPGLVDEFIWDMGTHEGDNSRPNPVQIYWAGTGQQRNGLAFVTRHHATDAVLLPVNHAPGGNRPMLGVEIRGVWYFTAHASSNGGSPNDSEEIIDRARHWMLMNAPNRDWMVLADFNRDPDAMHADLQRTMVRADDPTHEGGGRLDWMFTSNLRQGNFRVSRRGLNSDHWFVRYALVFAAGCLLPRPPARAAALAEDSQCGDPSPGYTYRLHSTHDDWPDRVMARVAGSPVFPRLVPSYWEEGYAVTVLYSRRPSTYKLKMGDDCLGRDSDGFGAAIKFASCDVLDQSSDWSFSNGKLISPDADEALTAGPRDEPGERYPALQMRKESYAWRFEDIEEPPGGTDPDGSALRKRDIRLMPLGDSITWGEASSDRNGFRDELYDHLSRTARNVDFVGSVRAGSMSDPDNEGHPGDRIDEIAVFADCSVERYQPNVITLHAGTNDMNQEYQLPSAPTRLKKLINQVLADSPAATVLAAQLIPTAKAGLQPRIDAYNAALPGVVKDLREEGKHVLLVDMDRVPVSDGLENDAHPTDAGYAKMADAWYEGVVEAADKGWIKDPLPEKGPGDCDPADSGVGSGETALGEGWRKLGVIAPGYGGAPGRTVITELDGDRRADYLQVRQDGSFRASVNMVGTPGQPDWVDVGVYKPAGTVPGEQVRFADLDGDGRDDYLVVSPDSEIRAYLNRAGAGGALDFVSFGVVFREESFSRDNLRFADVTGDGRDDILRVGAEGAVHVYRNQWDPTAPDVSDDPQAGSWPLWLNWAGGTRGSSLAAVRFADGDGDGQADYLQVGAEGDVHAFLNRGGGGNGSFKAVYHWANASRYPRKYVQFADISGDGKADYLVVYEGGAVRAWLNRGGNTPPPDGSGGEPAEPPQG